MAQIPFKMNRRNSTSYDQLMPQTTASQVIEETNKRFMTDAERTKLGGITAGAASITVVNNLTSTSATSALSAAQGKVLQDGKAAISHTHTTIKTADNLYTCSFKVDSDGSLIFVYEG